MDQENPPLPLPKRRMRRLLAMPLALVAVVALLYVVSRPLGGGAPRPSFFVIGSAAPGLEIGQIAPGTAGAVGSAALPLIGLDDRPVALTDFAGKPIWVSSGRPRASRARQKRPTSRLPMRRTVLTGWS